MLVFGTTDVDAIQQHRVTPPEATAGIWTVSAAGDRAVLKLVRLGGDSGSRWPSSPDPHDPYYWRREPLAYSSGLIESFGVPGVRAEIERDDGSVALWLEAVGDTEAWTVERFARVARRVGRAQAGEPPDEPWLARGWLGRYLHLHGVPPGPVHAALEQLPQALCHHDLHPGNVLDGDLIVDWAYCGHGARGSDAGVLVADAIADRVLAPELADETAGAVWRAYVEGLRESGWSGDDGDVRFAFARGTALRLAWLPRGERDEWDATVAFLQRLASDT
jgi:hypothetical protein